MDLQHDWRVLVGKRVEIRRFERVVRTGIVDSVMLDGSILWVAAGAEGGRQLVERAEDYQVWSRY